VVHFHSKTKTPAAKQAAPAHRDSTTAVLAFPPMRR
jgi:hypothetical protein